MTMNNNCDIYTELLRHVEYIDVLSVISLPPPYDYTIFIQDNMVWELTLELEEFTKN